MPSRSQLTSLIRLAQLTVIAGVVLYCDAAFAQNTPPSGMSSPGNAASSTSSQTPTASASTGTTVQIKKELTGDFTYRFISDKDQTSAPAPLPASAAADTPVPVSLPASIPAKSAILEVVDKSRGNVARIPLTSGTAITLTEASFKYVQTLFVTVQHQNKPVTDVLVTVSDASHKYSLAWPLKKTDAGTAQFANVPMGVAITVGVNGAGHPVLTQTNTITLDHPPDGYHWPAIAVDWSDVATVALPNVPVASTGGAASPQAAPADAGRDSRDSNSSGNQHTEDRGGGFFSSAVGTLFSIAFVIFVIWGVIWAFNKGHVKTLLDKAGINTADLSVGGTQQPNPFDKPARAPITPITDGTADPFGGPVAAPGSAPAGIVTGPRMIATTGAYSGSIFALSGAYSEIGRDAGNAVPLPNDTNASRKHATIGISGGEYTVTDNGSSNGTFLNGVRVPPNSPQPLRSGDEVQVGMTRFRFEA